MLEVCDVGDGHCYGGRCAWWYGRRPEQVFDILTDCEEAVLLFVADTCFGRSHAAGSQRGSWELQMRRAPRPNRTIVRRSTASLSLEG